MAALDANPSTVNMRAMATPPSSSTPIDMTALQQHLPGPEPLKPNGDFQGPGGAMYGTHNQVNAVAEITNKGGLFELQPSSTPGISTFEYVYQRNLGLLKYGEKTVYDPAFYSDADMLAKAGQAADQAWATHLATGQVGAIDTVVDGVKFRAYVNLGNSTGFDITNVHPIP